MTGAEIIEQDNKDFEADVKAMMEDAAPKTPLEAAIDRATGFADAGKDGRSGAPEPQPKEAGAEAREPEERDWVEEAWKCFIKDAGDIDPTDPVKAVEVYFQKNASDELKARCKAEGKDAKGCWRFIEAVARKALHGSSGHIDPGVVYAIAMHWYEDVPKDWDSRPEPRAQNPGKVEEGPTTKTRNEKPKAKPKAKAKPKPKPKDRQGFFFEMLETPVITPEKESEVQG